MLLSPLLEPVLNCCPVQRKAGCHLRAQPPDLDPTDGPFLVVDIGGGSTEFAYGLTECEAALSVDIGCVRLTEKYIESDPPAPEELLACLSITEAHLDDVARLIPVSLQAKTFVGLAGTVSAAAAVEIGLAEYDRDQIHHFKLSKEAAEDVYRTLVTEPREDRRHNPGLEEGRGRCDRGGHVHPGAGHALFRLRRMPCFRKRHPRRPGLLASGLSLYSGTDFAEARTIAKKKNRDRQRHVRCESATEPDGEHPVRVGAATHHAHGE